jgi:hypothetical protein
VKRLSAFALPALLALALGAAALAPAASAAADPFADGCPREALEEGASAKLNHNPAAKHAFVPAGAISLRICRYWGFGNESGKQTPKTQARAGKLNDQAEVHSKALLEGLTYEFRELEAAPKGPISCPFDDGTELYAVFFYRHAEPVIVHVALSGCRFAYAAAPRAREMTESLEKKLVRLAKGERVKSKPKHGEVTEKSRVANTPPHLSYARAKHSAETTLGFFCEESKLCASHSIGTCTRRTPAAFGCRYKAKLLTGEICTGTMSVKDYGGSISNSPGVQSSSEGECFYLFAPPHFKEEMEEEEREEAEEKEGGKHSSRAT